MFVKCIGVVLIVWIQEGWIIVVLDLVFPVLHVAAERISIRIELVAYTPGAKKARGRVVVETTGFFVIFATDPGYFFDPRNILRITDVVDAGISN
jgi:hypothetical protein